MPDESVQTPSRILLIRPSALGDVCRTVPVLAALKAWRPDASIDWLVQREFAPAVEAHPDLNEVIPFDRSAMRGWFRAPAPARRSIAFLRGLARRRYDLVIDAQGLARSAIFARVTRAPVRLGPSDAREFAPLAYTRRVATDVTHTVDRMLALSADLGADIAQPDMRLHTPASARAFRPDLSGAAVIAPTSRWPGKAWPDGRFAELIERLTPRRPVVVIGAPGEEPQIPDTAAIASSRDGAHNLVGQTTIAQTMSLIEHASLVVANDSAAAHMAVGFDRPLLALFGPTDTARVGPYRRDADVISHRRSGDPLDHKDERAGRELMERITIEEVVDACHERLSREPSAPNREPPGAPNLAASR